MALKISVLLKICGGSNSVSTLLLLIISIEELRVCLISYKGLIMLSLTAHIFLWLCGQIAVETLEDCLKVKTWF